MKVMPLPIDLQGKGVDHLLLRNKFISELPSHFNAEPTSVLDSARFPTSSSSHGGAASTDTAGVAAVSDTDPSPKWRHDSTTATSSADPGALLPVPPSLDIAAAAAGNPEKLAMEDWESVLSESVAVFPSQEQSFLRWIMGDVEDPTQTKSLQIGSAAPELAFSAGFGGNGDQGFGAGECFVPNFTTTNRSEKNINASVSNLMHNNSSSLGANLFHLPAFDSPATAAETKPSVFNPQLMTTHHPQNPSFFFPLSYPQDQSTFGPPLPKRHNPGRPVDRVGLDLELDPGGTIPRGSYTDTGQQQLQQEQLFMARQPISQQLQLLPPQYLQQRPKLDELGNCHQLQQQAIVDQIYKAAELVQTGNPVLAQGILARLNQQVSLIGKPFHRAAFYCKEALQLLLNDTNNNNNNLNPISLVFKIGAYKSFSEISPLVQFANFTCNQAILEALEGFDRVHIVDFDIGLGGQWGSLMQELALRPGGLTSLKVTALSSMSAHDQLELGLTRENLIQFASEVNIPFEFEAVSDSLNSGSWFRAPENEAVIVNLPIGSLAPFVLRFVKHLSPRIVVTMDRGCDRTDLPFANHIIHALQSYSNLLESLDAVNVNMDALQKIERFLLQPGLEKVVSGRFQTPEKTQHWRDLFLSSGLSPVGFSNFAESQAECLIKRTPVRGFQVEKRQSSLVLCWQRKELISVSAWRVC